MKTWGVILLVFLLKIQEKTVKGGEDEFIKRKGIQFWLNGSPFYSNGFNAYWLMYEGSEPSERLKVSTSFEEASKHGLTIARTWAFSDGGNRPLQYSPGYYNEQMFQVMTFFSSFYLYIYLFWVFCCN